MAGALRHDLTIQTRPISELTPWAKNPRDNDAAAEELAYTISEVGWTNPILLDKHDTIIAGHTRLKAALKLGLTEVPTITLDVDGPQAELIAIADNRLSEFAEWDNDALAEILSELKSEDLDLKVAGYSDSDYSQLLDALSEPGEDEWGGAFGGLPDEDRAPFRQMTFTVHDDQHEEIERALKAAKETGPFDSENENGNGNALARIAEAFLAGNG